MLADFEPCVNYVPSLSFFFKFKFKFIKIQYDYMKVHTYNMISNQFRVIKLEICVILSSLILAKTQMITQGILIWSQCILTACSHTEQYLLKRTMIEKNRDKNQTRWNKMVLLIPCNILRISDLNFQWRHSVYMIHEIEYDICRLN